MTDDLERGLGALPDSPDPRDYPIDALYAAEDLEPPALDTLPRAFRVPDPLAPVVDQGTSPMCVAYSSGWQKNYADRRDMTVWFDFDEPRFFHEIGGTENGAEVRWAMQRMVDVGYPVTGKPNSADMHRITAYYRVDNGDGMADRIRQALYTFKVPLVLSTVWFREWMRTKADGTLPAPVTAIGGHAIVVVGWREDGALELVNSWGTDWGVDGHCFMPAERLVHARAAWRAVDVIEHPVPYRHQVRTTARLRIRNRPRTNATKVGLIPDGATLITRQLERYGGGYEGPAGGRRTDWYQVVYGSHVGWVARAYTRIVK